MAHWTASLAPLRWKRSISYWCAVATALQVQFDGAAYLVLTADILTATINVCSNLTIEVTSWQIYLMILAIFILSAAMNTYAPALDAYSKITTTMAVIINCTVLFQAIGLLVRTHPKQSDYSVFLNVENQTGWHSLGVVFFFTILPGVASINGFNYVAHMTEEVSEPEKTVPQVMVISSLLSGVTSVLMIVVLIFCTIHPESLSDPIGGMPLAQILWDGNRSLVLTSINMGLMSFIFIIGSLGFVTSASRLIWTVSNHGGIALSEKLGEIDEKSQIPRNAVLFTTAFGVLICLLELGPATVLNALFGFSFLCTMFTYGTTIWLLIIRGRHLLPEKRYFKLGIWGLPINILGGSWLVVTSIFYCFPTSLPVDANNMNYAVPVFVGLLSLFIPNWYFYSKKRYILPAPLQLHDNDKSSDDNNI